MLSFNELANLAYPKQSVMQKDSIIHLKNVIAEIERLHAASAAMLIKTHEALSQAQQRLHQVQVSLAEEEHRAEDQLSVTFEKSSRIA